KPRGFSPSGCLLPRPDPTPGCPGRTQWLAPRRSSVEIGVSPRGTRRAEALIEFVEFCQVAGHAPLPSFPAPPPPLPPNPPPAPPRAPSCAGTPVVRPPHPIPKPRDPRRGESGPGPERVAETRAGVNHGRDPAEPRDSHRGESLAATERVTAARAGAERCRGS